MTFLAILATILFGAAVGLLAYSGRNTWNRLFEFAHDNLKNKLRRLRLDTVHLRRYLVAWSALVLIIFISLSVFAGSPLLGLFASGLTIGLPWYLLRRLAERRSWLIEDQLADAMVSLSSAIKAGLSLPQSLTILAQQCPRPICQEFQQMDGEYKLGKDLEQCLVETKQRLQSENFALFAAAIEASRQSGGRLNETVERIAHSVRELQRLERKIRSETAQARTSATYMALCPPLILMMNYALDPVHTRMLFTEPIGQVILIVAGLLNLVAFFWAKAILNPEF